jgi:hypothetical protein
LAYDRGFTFFAVRVDHIECVFFLHIADVLPDDESAAVLTVHQCMTGRGGRI